jgi:hypothetical protein
LEEEGQWVDHEIDGRKSYRRIQPTCSGYGTGRLQQEMRSGGHGPKTGRSAVEDDEEEYR